MKLSHIMISNVLGIHDVDVPTPTPITLFAGSNGAGKTSIQQAIRMALTSDPARVTKKKDYDQLVHEGEMSGSIQIDIDDEPFIFVLPSGERDGQPMPSTLPYCLDPNLFMSLDDKAKRSFLFKRAKLKISAEEVAKRLIERELDRKKCGIIIAEMKTGFPAAHDQAKSNATECKGSWKAITGETYGTKKAEIWEAYSPEEIDTSDVESLKLEINELKLDFNQANQQLGVKKQQLEDNKTSDKRAEFLEKKIENKKLVADSHKKAVASLNKATKALEKIRSAAGDEPNDPQICPLCGGEVETIDGELCVYTPKEFDSKAAAQLPVALEDLEGATKLVRSIKLQVDEVTRAETEFNALPQAHKINEAGLAQAESDVLDLGNNVDGMQDRLDIMVKAKEAIDKAAEDTKTAKQYHQDCLDWLGIAAALAPDGIPGELLGEALAPMNQVLTEAAKITGWLPPRILLDMTVKAAGRPYALLSESEQWRVDAMLAVAIAKLSGCKLLMLDRFDVLDIPSRGKLLSWLNNLVDHGVLDSAVLFGTLKACPEDTKRMTSHWLVDGVIGSNEAAA